MNKIVMILLLGSALQANDFYYEYGKRVSIVKSFETRNGSDVKFYENSLGKKIGIKDEILLQCREDSNCSTLFTKYNISKVEKLSSKIYLIKVPEDQDIFVLSQKLYNEPSIKYAHPNFVKERTRR